MHGYNNTDAEMVPRYEINLKKYKEYACLTRIYYTNTASIDVSVLRSFELY